MYVSCMTLVFRNIKGRLNYMVRHITMSLASLIAHKYSASDIIAMDETPVWCDMISETNVDARGKKTITHKSTVTKKRECRSVLPQRPMELN